MSTIGLINSDGHVDDLSGSALFRNYSGDPVIGIHIDQSVTLGFGSQVQVLLDPDGSDNWKWNSTVSFTSGIPVTLDGKLDLEFAQGVDLAGQLGKTYNIFNWTGVTPSGSFAISSPHGWDTSNLYTTGDLTLTAALVGSAFQVHDGLVNTNLTGTSIGLAKSTAGTVTLTGNNTYTGATTITQGTLQIGAGGTTGSLSDAGGIINDAALVFNRSNAYTYSGVISGTGSLTQLGNGTLILTGSNTYIGGTIITAGTLQIGDGATTGSLADAGSIINNASLIFDRSNAYIYNGAIAGSGSVTKAGTGMLTLTSANTYTGGTTVANDVLAVNGSIQGPVTVNFAGTLAGNATIHGSVTSGGQLAPGNSPGIIHIDGDYTQTATSALEIEVGGRANGSASTSIRCKSAAMRAQWHVSISLSSTTTYHPQLNDEITFLTAEFHLGRSEGRVRTEFGQCGSQLGLCRHQEQPRSAACGLCADRCPFRR